MKKRNFITSNFNEKESKSDKSDKRILVLIGFLILINLFICKENLTFASQNNLPENEEKVISQQLESVDTLESLLKKINIDQIPIKEININNSSVELQVFIKDKREYLELIKKIENVYSIKSISPIINEMNKSFVKVVIWKNIIKKL